MTVQDISQDTGSVSDDSGATTLVDSQQDQDSNQTSEAEASSDSVEGQETAPDTQVSPQDWKKRFDGLQSSSNKQRAQYEREREALIYEVQRRDQHIQALSTQLQEVSQKVDAITKGQSPQEQEPDYSNIKTVADIARLAKEEARKAREESEAGLEEKFKAWEQKKAEAARAEAVKQAEAKREEWFQGRWNSLQEKQPALDRKELEAFMMKNHIFDPESAFIIKNLDKYVEAKMKGASKQATEKITKNIRNATEGLAGTSRMPPKIQTPGSDRKSTPKSPNLIKDWLRTTFVEPPRT